MRLSLIFELLLIFVLLAFAASKAIDKKHVHHIHKSVGQKAGKFGNKKRQDDANKFCSCSSKLCNCCREFNLPVVALQGPGCASLQYLSGDRLAISMSFGERVLTNTTISGKKPKPVCMPLPGGVSKFCGRVYNIGRQGEDFKACLGLELRALEDVEASLRVSCFRFGPNGLKAEPAQPLPVVEDEEGDDDDDDDDDDEDDYGFDVGDEDDDYEDDNDVDSGDYTALSVFDDDFVGGLFGTGSDDGDNDVPVKPAPSKPVKKVTPAPVAKPTKKPTKSTIQKLPTKSTTTIKITAKPTTAPIKTSTEIPNETASVSSPPHESIAAVAAMLQDVPEKLPSQNTPAPVTIMTNVDINNTPLPLKNENLTTVSISEITTTAPNLLVKTPNKNEKVHEHEEQHDDDDDDDEDDEDEDFEEDDDDEEENESHEGEDSISTAVGEVVEDELDDDDDDDDEEEDDNKKDATTMKTTLFEGNPTSAVPPVTKFPKKENDDSDEDPDELVDEVIDTFEGTETTTSKSGETTTFKQNENDENQNETQDVTTKKSRRSKDMRFDRL